MTRSEQLIDISAIYCLIISVLFALLISDAVAYPARMLS